MDLARCYCKFIAPPRHARVRPGRPASAPRGPAACRVRGRFGSCRRRVPKASRASACRPSGQQVAAHAGQPVVLASAPSASSASTRSSAARGPKAMPTATARFSSATGEGMAWTSASRHDARPVGILGASGAGMAGRQRRLAAGAERAAQRLGARQRQSASDQQQIPAGAVLVHQQHGRPRASARAARREAAAHQRDQAVRLAVAVRQLRQDAAQAQRSSHSAGRVHLARRGGIAFVEDQVDHFQHRGQPRGARPPGTSNGTRAADRLRWRARCVARWWTRRPGRRARFRPSTGRPAAAASAPRAPRWTAADGRP